MKHMAYFDYNLHTYARQHCLTTVLQKKPFSMDKALLRISPAGHGQLVQMLITLDPHGIFGSNVAYLF